MIPATVRGALLLAGFAALLVAPFVLPSGRGRTARDPLAAAVLHLAAVEPGMRRSVLESHLHQVTVRRDGSEVFCHPDSDFLRIDIRLSGPQPDATVLVVGDPYLAHYPTPRHLP